MNNPFTPSFVTIPTVFLDRFIEEQIMLDEF